ncbi:unnamed protein product [Cuscuta europaea]|uniref:Replication protein A 70 kDa DNA-binding subunit B/D first OB fold domain-containing protein n=1 Tax=Cuscuta europaea TaxID=41803 RepID=A0A9P1E6Q5_CUSEU|nr:unnamed protein product [Cuscuta europaea]
MSQFTLTNPTMATTKEIPDSNNSNLYSMIKEVNHARCTWALRVRVVRAYEVSPQSKGVARMEVVFHDEDGDRIHAVVKRPFMHLYRKKLLENKCFRIKNFLVLDNYYNYKTTKHPHVLEFFKKTTMYDLHEETFPDFVFNFHQFDALQSLGVENDKFLIDVIGKYVGKTPVQTPTVNGKPERLIELTLEDREYCPNLQN